MGELAFERGDFGEAERCYERAVECASKNESALAHTSLADVYAVQKRVVEAENEYVKAIASDPAYTLARRNLAAVLARSGQYAKAAKEFEHALALAPNDADLWGGLALTYQLQGQYRRAIDYYERALAVDPAHTHARASLNHLRERIGELPGGR